MRVIRRYARQVAEAFHPDKIILFGSFAYGTPHAGSDVDLFVVMPCRNELDQAARIRWKVPAPFPMDMYVRKPSELEWRLRERESFTTEVVTKGKVLYEKADSRMGAQGRSRSSGRHQPRHKSRKKS